MAWRGAAVWVVADGFVKAALFIIVAIVQHRYDRLGEGQLHGAARRLWPLGAVFALGALTIASLPPTGSFLGRSLVEDAARRSTRQSRLTSFPRLDPPRPIARSGSTQTTRPARIVAATRGTPGR